MGFTEYLWSLILGVMKKVKNTQSDVYKFINAFGNILDDVKEAIFIVRRQGIITTAKGRALELHGGGRKVIRYAGESDEQYRKRILFRKEIARKSGTCEGIITAIKSLGYENVKIRPLYLIDPLKWAEFDILIDENEIDLRDLDILIQNVMKVKQASSLPNYGFKIGFNSIVSFEVLCINTISINFWGNRSFYIDGSWFLDGSYFLNGSDKTTDLNRIIVSNCLSLQNKEDFNYGISIEHDLWYLDGNVGIDGSNLLDSEIVKEVL